MSNGNPRKQDREAWLVTAEQEGRWTTPREGKRVALFSVQETQAQDGKTYRYRRVMRIIERTIDKNGQMLLLPENRNRRLVDFTQFTDLFR